MKFAFHAESSNAARGLVVGGLLAAFAAGLFVGRATVGTPPVVAGQRVEPASTVPAETQKPTEPKAETLMLSAPSATPSSAQPPIPVAPPIIKEQPKEPPAQNTINLLALIDPNEDAVRGTWRLANGVLSCEEGMNSRIQINYQPPEEYDFKIVFRRRSGVDEIFQILALEGRAPFRWLMGGWKNTVMAFDLINGGYGNRNQTTHPNTLTNDTVYTSVVKVRNDGVSAWLNGEMVCEWKTDFQDVDLWREFKVPDTRALGLGCQLGVAEFSVIELHEVTGKGRVLERKIKHKPTGPAPAF